MKKICLFVLLVPALLFGFERVSETQTKPERTLLEQDKHRPQIIALKPGEPEELTYDAGTVRFLAPSEATHGAWSLVELNGTARLQNAHSPARVYGRNLLRAGRGPDRQNRRQNIRIACRFLHPDSTRNAARAR